MSDEYDVPPDPEWHTEEEIAAWHASREANKRADEELRGIDSDLDRLDRQHRVVQAAAAIVTAANHFHDEATLIEAVSVHTRQLRGRDEFERLVDHLAIVIQMLADGSPAAMIDQLANAIRQP